ncbi:MAG: hypothetical protein ASARMPREDX12_004575 [Alectoria sarmentosa]|nr:MAG: hypothetical protein ASARMPREDX12_004575 [Alectoria sarmentosa]
MNPNPSPVLTLPPELRNQILETLFFGAQLSTLCKCHRRNPFQRANYGILATNKQLHCEASNILFHGAVLRLDIAQEMMDYLPSLVTKTVIPAWSWSVRDRYRDKGTDLEFLQGWQGLRRVRYFEMSLPSELMIDGLPRMTEEGMWRYLTACDIAVGFVNGLPDVESLTIDTDADGSAWLEKCKEKLRAMISAKLVILDMDDCCGHQL